MLLLVLVKVINNVMHLVKEQLYFEPGLLWLCESFLHLALFVISGYLT